MITSKDVFAKRKQGAFDEAYQLALQLMASPDAGDWDRKAMGWCLIDLIKREAQAGNHEHLEDYRRQLEDLEVAADDDILQKGIRNALSLCSPNGLLIRQASDLSRASRYAEAVALYRKAWTQGELDTQTQTSLGWDLYKHAKQLLAAEHVNFGAIKRDLHDYLRLSVEKPSVLHACFLQIAAKLASLEKLNLLKFLQLWDLKYLRDEDWQRHKADDGKEYPSLVEKVIQQAGKEAAASEDTHDLEYILPHIDAAIQRYPDNLWLKLDKAKVLLAAGRNDEALSFAMEVAKAKGDEYWAWELLGDVVVAGDPTAALGCYSKALLCHADEKFTGKVRLKLARLMIEANDLAPAKHEVESVLHQKEKDGLRVPDVAAQISSEPWFLSTRASETNEPYYRSHSGAAESLILSKLPWMDANLGEPFVIPGMENKPKRKVFIKTPKEVLEASLPEWKLKGANFHAGDGIRVKGEFDAANRFKIYTIEARPTEARWDVFPTLIGVVDHVNRDKNILHFIVDRTVQGLIPLGELPDQLNEGDAIAVKLSHHSSKRGVSYRVLSANATQEKPSSAVLRQFSDEVRVSNGMGFTLSDIFIPPPQVAAHGIQDGQTISGAAILSFNKKRQNWGWKSISVEVVFRP